MEWHRLGAAGSSRDLWVSAKCTIGDLAGRLPDGRTVRSALRADGPADLPVDVWFTPQDEEGGTRLRDMVWDTGRCGVKMVSTRLADLLCGLDPTVRQVPVDLRGRRGESIEGYVAVLEEVGTLSPVHSMKRAARGSALVVSREVRDRVRAGEFSGLDWTELDNPFPAD